MQKEGGNFKIRYSVGRSVPRGLHPPRCTPAATSLPISAYRCYTTSSGPEDPTTIINIPWCGHLSHARARTLCNSNVSVLPHVRQACCSGAICFDWRGVRVSGEGSAKRLVCYAYVLLGTITLGVRHHRRVKGGLHSVWRAEVVRCRERIPKYFIPLISCCTRCFSKERHVSSLGSHMGRRHDVQFPIPC